MKDEGGGNTGHCLRGSIVIPVALFNGRYLSTRRSKVLYVIQDQVTVRETQPMKVCTGRKIILCRVEQHEIESIMNFYIKDGCCLFPWPVNSVIWKLFPGLAVIMFLLDKWHHYTVQRAPGSNTGAYISKRNSFHRDAGKQDLSQWSKLERLYSLRNYFMSCFEAGRITAMGFFFPSYFIYNFFAPH